MKKSYLVDYADELLKDQSRSEKIKRTKKRKRVEEQIAVAIINGNAKTAVFYAEKYGITPQDFGKMVARYSQFCIK